MTITTLQILAIETPANKQAGSLPKSVSALVELASELREACHIAPCFEDGGASNFDTLEILSRRNSKLEAALDAMGLRYSYETGPARYAIQPVYAGQGARRTLQAQAMRAAAIRKGVDASVNYRID